jgi:thiamine-monophosphate kinase
VHFRRTTSSAGDVGWKALAINASDIAAMGGHPRHAVISLMLPGDLPVDWVDGLYDGLLEMAACSGVAVVGGNLAQAPVAIIDVALLGDVEPDRLIRRDGARPGDLVAVTGTLGRAAAGLIALTAEMTAQPGDARGSGGRDAPDATLLARAASAQRRPSPRLSAGPVLASAGGVTAMIDVSDGLAIDLHRICEASHVGVRVDAARLPIDPCVAPIAAASGRDALRLALTGGEDYELLFAVSADAADRVLGRLADETGVEATVIGRFEPAASGRTIADVESHALEGEGWTHFRTR